MYKVRKPTFRNSQIMHEKTSNSRLESSIDIFHQYKKQRARKCNSVDSKWQFSYFSCIICGFLKVGFLTLYIRKFLNFYNIFNIESYSLNWDYKFVKSKYTKVPKITSLRVLLSPLICTNLSFLKKSRL